MHRPHEKNSGVSPEESFLTGDSEMAALILARDWSGTALGPISSWPQSLRTTVSLCLASNFPINIIWGPQHSQIYNDGYRVLCGDKHPASLGMDYTECWASAWPALATPFEKARGGQTSYLENQRMFLFRNGYLEETFFTFSLSPIRDESGAIGGLFHPVTETTAIMLSARRTRALRDLTAQLGSTDSRAGLVRCLMQTLAQFELDLPFALLYELDPAGGAYRLLDTTGMAAGGTPVPTLAPPVLAPDDASSWPLPALMTADAALRVDGLRARLQGVACGPYDEPPASAFALPIRLPGSARPDFLLMAGVSARLPLDDAYAGFYDLLGAALAAALARVDAAEAERKRAEMLAAVDHAKTVFFSNVSHEFRTPLTLMLGPLEDVLQDAGLAPSVRARLDIANRNALRLLRLVNSLLDFSRIEAGRIEAGLVPTALAPLTADLASNFRSACERAGLALAVECAPLRDTVDVDPAMWETIVLNLLSNAFKFTLAGGIRVVLREAGGMAELQVIDSGVGIPAADIGRVFERFHRVEGQAGRSVEGSGIGLSLVRELVQLHGGTIEVASAQGAGTRFTLRLPFSGPRRTPAAPAPRAAAANVAQRYVDEAMGWLPDESPIETQPQAAAAGPRGRILLADDNADMRAYIKRILEEGGYEVEALANGRQALDAVRAAAGAGRLPDLVLSDVMMPELDGFALLAALRADPATRDVVMLLLSARAGEEARLDGLGAGADDYLVKPFGARELRARVDGAVTLARQRREAAAREQALRVEVATARGRTALMRSQAHAAALFEQTTVGMAEASLDGILLRVNQRYAEMIGVPREDIVGLRVDAFLHPEDAPDNRALFAGLVSEGTPYELENRFLRPDGRVLWVGKTVSLVRNHGAPTTVLAVYMDVTGRKQAEAALHDAARRKDEFLAMLAHELRNPLAPIRAAAEMMGLAQLDATRIRRTSEIIGRQVRHMTGLIDDLLDVSRVTRGLVEIDKTPQEVGAIVASAVEQVRPLIASQRHRLLTDFDPAGGRVLGDEKRLVQILTNLLNNAAKYTPPGGVIHLRTEVEPDCVHIVVRDTGIGIARELRARVFDLFAQAERTPDRSQGGLGLGLALVKNLVELHGGRVACHSAGLGKGSTFVVELPRLLDEDPVAVGQAAPARQDGAGPLDILVVDDNADAAFMLKVLLEQWGHRVRVEHDAWQALDSAAREAPDVALLDIGLPGLDGNELARRLRGAPGTAATTLVAITGYGQALDRQRTRDAGFDHHLVKPVDTADLVAVLDEAGKARRAQRAHIDMREIF